MVYIKNRVRKIIIVGISAVSMWMMSVSAEAAVRETKIHFIALNNSTDAILLESNGHYGLVDSGEDWEYPDGADERYPLRSDITQEIGYEQQVIHYLKKQGVTKVGILATDGTVQSKIYDKALVENNITAIYPSEKNQKLVMSLIYDCVKSNKMSYNDIPIEEVIKELYEQGVQKIILACTELPIAFENLGIKNNCVDPTLILANAAIHWAGAKTINKSINSFAV